MPYFGTEVSFNIGIAGVLKACADFALGASAIAADE